MNGKNTLLAAIAHGLAPQALCGDDADAVAERYCAEHHIARCPGCFLRNYAWIVLAQPREQFCLDCASTAQSKTAYEAGICTGIDKGFEEGRAFERDEYEETLEKAKKTAFERGLRRGLRTGLGDSAPPRRQAEGIPLGESVETDSDQDDPWAGLMRAIKRRPDECARDLQRLNEAMLEMPMYSPSEYGELNALLANTGRTAGDEQVFAYTEDREAICFSCLVLFSKQIRADLENNEREAFRLAGCWKTTPGSGFVCIECDSPI